MSITILNNIYGTLFNPLETFENIKKADEKPVFEAFSVLVIISIIACIYTYKGSSIIGLGFSLVSYVIGALLTWVIFAGILDTLVTLLSEKRNFDTFLVLSAYSLLPWIFLGPVSLFKSTGPEGLGLVSVLLGILFSLIVWLWSTILFICAVSKSYGLSIEKVIGLVIMPFLGTLVAFFWVAGFITNLISIIGT